ncbi:MAG TPA: sodium-translocating pyrophosphatase, partial [Bacteroidales bacterium]|nr:sodium-translocating pyrophosphatase [Bacteroidales bacterium]
YNVVTKVFLILVVLLGILAYMGVQNPFVPVAFLTGGFFSGLCGFLGMKTATFASNRTAWAASKSLNKGLQVALRSGAVMGLVVVGFGLLDVALWFIILNKLVFTPEHMDAGLKFLGLTFVHPGTTDQQRLIEITAVMLTFGMGASTQALFARVGGGIFTKAADVGADLVGKVEAGIPEDDPRNPATIADNVGDNVGDVAGMGADLYESYAGSVLATAALGAALPSVAGDVDLQMKAVIAPMIVSAIGILLSIAGVYLVRTKESATPKNLLNALLLGTGGSSALILVAMAVMASTGWITWGVFGSVVAGLLSGVIIGQSTEYFTSDGYKPTKGIAKQAQQGPATVIIEGMAVGMFSTWVPVITIVAGIVAAFGFAGGFHVFAKGVYGIGFAAVGMLSTLGITLATDAFGPIADNAGGNAEMAELPPEVRDRTDALDGLGNTTAATGKGFAIGSAALTALALMAAYMEEVKLWLGRLADKAPEGFKQIGDTLFYHSTVPTVHSGQTAVDLSTATIRDFVSAYDLSLFNPVLLGGIFIGAMMAFVFSAMSMKAVGRAAGSMVEEVRRQFREIPGIMEGTGKPEYAKCVAISTAGAQKEMMVPALMAIAVPFLVGLIFGVPGIVGLLAGGMTAGFTLASMLNNAGGAWDNAKKYIERGHYGGKKSDPHKASVVGDTVGDPFKDTSGPSLNILIKLMSMVSVVLAGITVAYSLF